MELNVSRQFLSLAISGSRICLDGAGFHALAADLSPSPIASSAAVLIAIVLCGIVFIATAVSVFLLLRRKKR
jgi:hypothetical protein